MAQDTVQEIKNRLSIADVVAPYVKLKRAGRSMVGLCPFHKEKTGSFHVSPERGTWHCFGCGEGGDMFSFVEKIEGVDFKGALKILADKAGVQIVHDPRAKERGEKNDRLHEAMNRAAQRYAQQLPGSTGEAYAEKRGLTDVTIKDWSLGYAPDGWRTLLDALAVDGFSTQESLAAGLIKEADGKPGTYYDRFRNRLIFPIRDSAGRVVAFTGRALSADEPAKYLNSPETDLYHKSDVLFAFDRAKEAIRTRGYTLLVEGQMDALHAHQAGFANAVALSGTALTDKHVVLMKRVSDNLMLALDADPAGLSATAKAAMLALRQGLRVKAARLPTGKDPADIIGEDPAAFAAALKQALPVVEFFLAVLAEREHDQLRLVRAAEQIVLPLIAALPSPMEREHSAAIAARALGLSTEAVRESLAKVKRADSAISSPSRAPEALAPRRTPVDMRRGQLLAVVHAYPDTALAERVKAEYGRITGAPGLPAYTAPESELFQAEESLGEAPDEGAADELLHAFEEAVIREAYQEAIGELRRAETAGGSTAAAEAKCATLSARLAVFSR